MPTATCTHKGCEKSFTHPTQNRVDQALRLHIGRVHSRTVVQGSELIARPRRGRPAKNGHVHAEDVQPKRKYVRRKPVVEQVHVNFCPCCGCNLQAVATGIAMAAHT